MAYTKKTATENNEEGLPLEDTQEEPTVAKQTSSKANQKDDKDKEIEQLKAQIALLMDMMTKQNASTNTEAMKNSLLDEVIVVHLVERAPGLTTHIELTTTTLDMAKFGEQRTLDRRQAEELAGKYRSFFEKGIIALGAGNEEFADRCGLKTVASYRYLSNDFLEKLATMDVKELEKFYGLVDAGHKAFIVEYFQRKSIEGDPRFKDSVKLEALNRLSGNAVSGVMLDMQKATEE